MKHLLRSFIFNAAALYLANYLIPGFSIASDFWQTLLLASAALFLLNTLLKPIFNLLLMPINLLTLGLFRWVINVINLFILTRIIPQLTINAFFFPGASLAGISFPAVSLGRISVLVITGIFIGLVINLLTWISD